MILSKHITVTRRNFVDIVQGLDLSKVFLSRAINGVFLFRLTGTSIADSNGKVYGVRAFQREYLKRYALSGVELDRFKRRSFIVEYVPVSYMGVLSLESSASMDDSKSFYITDYVTSTYDTTTYTQRYEQLLSGFDDLQLHPQIDLITQVHVRSVDDIISMAVTSEKPVMLRDAIGNSFLYKFFNINW